MLTPKQIRIFGAFLKQPYAEKTYREIKEFSKEKSNSVIQKAIAKFLSEGLVAKRKVGNIFLHAINLENTPVFSYFDILAKEQLPHLAKLCLRQIVKEISSVSFVSIVVFGSYAEGKQKESSDLDIALFVNNKTDKRECELAMKDAEMKCAVAIHTYVFTKSEMLQMLKDKDENLGKQIARNHIVIYNPASFYSIINEGIKRGFKPVC